MKAKLRLLIPIVLLLILVGIGILIFRPQGKTHTHFVVLNPLSFSEHFDAAQSPVFPMVEGQRFPSGQSSQEAPQVLSIDGNPPSGVQLGSHDALVVCLQTQILAGANQDELICLSKNSTPDLTAGRGQSAQFRTVSDLKDQLIDFRKRSNSPILLIVDCLSSVQDRRLGKLPLNTFEVFKSWAQDQQLPNLAVIVSSGEAGISATAPIGSGGQTAFGHIVTQGFSTLADKDENGELRLGEFCRYVQETVSHWSMTHRHLAGQQVQTYPAVKEISGHTDFTLMKDIPTVESQLEYREDNATAEKLNALWQQRDQLNDLMAWRWSPSQWQSSTEFLLRAQEAYLNGNGKSSIRLMEKARRSLADISQSTRRVATKPGDLNQQFGLPRSWFSRLPLHENLNELWDQPSEPTATTLPSATAVLEANRNDYPFEALNLHRPKEIGFRDQAEAIASKLMTVSQWVEQTVRKAESDLLNHEDNLFTRADKEPSDSPDENVELWQAIERFAEAHQEAELEYQRTLRQSDSLSLWAAEFPFEQPAEHFEDWDALLRQNLPTTNVTPATASTLETKALQIADKCGPGISGQSARLRSSIFSLLVWTRVVRSSLSPAEPDGGFSAKQLADISDLLRQSQSKCQQYRQAIDREFKSIAEGVSQTVATRPEQVLSYQRHRGLLRMTGLDSTTRSQLVTGLWRLEEQLAEPVTDTGDSSVEAETPSVIQRPAKNQRVKNRPVTQDALWYLQSLNLLATNDQQNHPATEIGNAIVSVKGSQFTNAEAGRYGKSVRDFFVSRRTETDQAVYQTGLSAAEQLRTGDQFSRALSAFDSQLLTHPPTRTLHAAWQTHFALTQADRRLQGLWVLPGESKPWNVNGWYGRVSRTWLSHASAIIDAEYSSRPVPGFLSNGITEAEKLFEKTAGLSVSISVQNRLISIGDQNGSQKDLNYSLSTTSVTADSGTAAVSFQPAEQSPATKNIVFEQNGDAVPLGANGTKSTTVVSRQGAVPAAECQPVDYLTSVFFRGRRWSSASAFTVDPCPTPEFVTTRYARPATASITLAGTDKRPIIFVLDMSGSMNKTVDGKTRAQLAIETLNRVIRNLTENDVVSIKVFGHRVKYESARDPDSGQQIFRTVANPKWRRAFDKQLSPNSDIETILMPVRLTPRNRKAVEEVLKELNQSGPWGITPLAGAIQETLSGRIDDGNLADRPGVVVAISDGLATDIGRDQDAKESDTLNRTSRLRDSLTSNASSKVVLVALDFEPGSPQRTALEEVFVKECGIPVFDAIDQKQLLTQVQQSLDPRQYSVQRLTTSESTQQDFGKPVDQLKTPDRYNLIFADVNLPEKSAISLKQGDNLQVEVDWKNREFLFKRDKASQMKSQAKGPQSNKDAPTILRAVAPAAYNTYSEPGKESVRSVQISLMLDHERRNLPVQQPEEIEFQIHQLDGTTPNNVTERFTSEWGAPGWKIGIEDWPVKQYIRVNAIWKMNRTAPELVMACPPADQPKIEIGDQTLPKAFVTTTVLPGGTLRVRLDPVQGVPYADDNQVSDVRVETGVPDLRNNNQAFRPDEDSTTIRRIQTGSLVIDFEGQFTKESLNQVRLAFTSAQSRRTDAFILPQPLKIDTITTEN